MQQDGTIPISVLRGQRLLIDVQLIDNATVPVTGANVDTVRLTGDWLDGTPATDLSELGGGAFQTRPLACPCQAVGIALSDVQ